MSEAVSIPIAKLVDCKGEVSEFQPAGQYRCHICDEWMSGGMSPCQRKARACGKLAADRRREVQP